MKSPKCRTCGKEHALGGCPEFQSTAARKDVQAITESFIDGDALDARSQKPLAAGTQALPVGILPQPKKGRPPKEGTVGPFSKGEYMKSYMKDLRTIKRLGLNCTVAIYRAGKYGETK